MKRRILYLFVMSLMLTIVNVEMCAAESKGPYTLMLQKENTPTGGQEWEVDDEGRRAPSRPVNCNISLDSGVTISGCSEKIVRYEIWNVDGDVCLFVCTDQTSFLDVIFSSHGNLMIRLQAGDYTYAGYISLL